MIDVLTIYHILTKHNDIMIARYSLYKQDIERERAKKCTDSLNQYIDESTCRVMPIDLHVE